MKNTDGGVLRLVTHIWMFHEFMFLIIYDLLSFSIWHFFSRILVNSGTKLNVKSLKLLTRDKKSCLHLLTGDVTCVLRIVNLKTRAFSMYKMRKVKTLTCPQFYMNFLDFRRWYLFKNYFMKYLNEIEPLLQGVVLNI